MRLLAILFISLAAVGAWAAVGARGPIEAASRDDACSGVRALGSLDLVPLPMTYTVSNAVDASRIEVKSRTLVAYLGKGWHTGGLASFKAAYTPTTKVSGRVVAGTACLGLQSLTVSYGYPDPVEILVLNKYREGSCQYAEILRHEFEHYEIYRSSAFDDVDAKEAAMRSYVESRLPVRAATEKEANAAIASFVNQAVRSLADGVSSDAKARNAAIDNPENYARIRSLCPPEVRR